MFSRYDISIFELHPLRFFHFPGDCNLIDNKISADTNCSLQEKTSIIAIYVRDVREDLYYISDLSKILHWI